MTGVKPWQGVSAFDQFHLHARRAISGGSARHLGTSWKTSSLALNLHSSSLCPSSPFQFTSFSSWVARLRRMLSLKLNGRNLYHYAGEVGHARNGPAGQLKQVRRGKQALFL